MSFGSADVDQGLGGTLTRRDFACSRASKALGSGNAAGRTRGGRWSRGSGDDISLLLDVIRLERPTN